MIPYILFSNLTIATSIKFYANSITLVVTAHISEQVRLFGCFCSTNALSRRKAWACNHNVQRWQYGLLIASPGVDKQLPYQIAG